MSWYSELFTSAILNFIRLKVPVRLCFFCLSEKICPLTCTPAWRRTSPMLRLLPRSLRAALPCVVGVAAGVCAAAEPADEWTTPHTADPSDMHADGEPAFVHAELRAIYSSLPDVHAIPESEEEVIDATGGHEGYGELTPHGTSALLRLIPLCQQADRFYDLGSGSGVVTTHLALLGFRAVGIELSPTRHAVAAAALDRVPSPHRGEAACEARLPPRWPRP